MIYDLDVERVDSVQAGPQSLELVAHCFAYADDYDEAKAAAESLADGSLLCGWAFDAGMREAERDDERSRPNREASRRYAQESRHLSEMSAAVAAERERCAKVEEELRAELARAVEQNGNLRTLFDETYERWVAQNNDALRLKRILEDFDKPGAPAPREG